MSTKSTSARPIKKFLFFFKKNRRDFIGAKHTPGCAFLFFLQEKTLTQCNAWEWWPQIKGVCLTLQPRKNYELLIKSTGLFSLCFPRFPCVFLVNIYFVWVKVSVVFFCYCLFDSFSLCLFVRF